MNKGFSCRIQTHTAVQSEMGINFKETHEQSMKTQIMQQPLNQLFYHCLTVLKGGAVTVGFLTK